MIWGTWIDPNFTFRAAEKEKDGDDEVIYQHICYANGEDELRRGLEKKNLRVEWIRPYDFEEWRIRARDARKKAEDAYNAGKRPIPFKRAIWDELKWHLFELFHGKCAYCESKTLHVAYGDVEHFRPKSKVEEDTGHPGYYWLAYAETNLLPSCTLCNQARGKMAHFPVEGIHSRIPDDLLNEKPLLLNPYNKEINPFHHLEFGPMGEALARNFSPYGEQSRKFYHLNRPDLSAARRDALGKVERDFNVLMGILTSQERARKALKDEIILGLREYSAAQLWHLDRIAQSSLGA